MWHGDAFRHIIVFACMCVCPVLVLTCENFELETSFLVCSTSSEHLDMCVCQGDLAMVNVKVVFGL